MTNELRVSIHAPHEGERLGQIFLSVLLDKVSIHAPHEGERHILLRAPFCPWRFNPRSPRGGATFCYSPLCKAKQSFNPRSPRGGATCAPTKSGTAVDVSIHAPHEGERHVRPPNRGRLSTFQSTLPTRGSDSSFTASSNDIKVSIHAPHEGERRVCPCACINSSTVSIHAPHEGERLSAISIDSAAASGFNPRSPRGGATCFLCRCFLRQKFQSTLPTRGSDYQSARRRVRQRRFNPRSPRGGATTISPHGDMI